MSRARRLFVAVRPPTAVQRVLAGLEHPEDPGLRFTPPEQWHVTLRFLGDSDPEEVLGALRGEHLMRCTAVLGPAVGTLGDRVVMVPVVGLEDLAAQVRRCTQGIGRPPEHPFRGHLTLARARSRAVGPPLGEPLSARWVPEEVEVVSSITGAHGAQHRVIATLPIG